MSNIRRLERPSTAPSLAARALNWSTLDSTVVPVHPGTPLRTDDRPFEDITTPQSSRNPAASFSPDACPPWIRHRSFPLSSALPTDGWGDRELEEHGDLTAEEIHTVTMREVSRISWLLLGMDVSAAEGLSTFVPDKASRSRKQWFPAAPSSNLLGFSDTPSVNFWSSRTQPLRVPRNIDKYRYKPLPNIPCNLSLAYYDSHPSQFYVVSLCGDDSIHNVSFPERPPDVSYLDMDSISDFPLSRPPDVSFLDIGSSTGDLSPIIPPDVSYLIFDGDSVYDVHDTGQAYRALYDFDPFDVRDKIRPPTPRSIDASSRETSVKSRRSHSLETTPPPRPPRRLRPPHHAVHGGPVPLAPVKAVKILGEECLTASSSGYVVRDQVYGSVPQLSSAAASRLVDVFKSTKMVETKERQETLMSAVKLNDQSDQKRVIAEAPVRPRLMRPVTVPYRHPYAAARTYGSASAQCLPVATPVGLLDDVTPDPNPIRRDCATSRTVKYRPGYEPVENLAPRDISTLPSGPLATLPSRIAGLPSPYGPDVGAVSGIDFRQLKEEMWAEMRGIGVERAGKKGRMKKGLQRVVDFFGGHRARAETI